MHLELELVIEAEWRSASVACKEPPLLPLLVSNHTPGMPSLDMAALWVLLEILEPELLKSEVPS